MKYNFTDMVRKTLARAREEAVALGHDYVGTEHLLLGLAATEDAVGARILGGLGADPAAVMRRVRESVRPGKGACDRPGGDLPYTSRAKKVLELSMSEARGLGHDYVGTEHLLLGIIREERGIAAVILKGFGIDLEGARAAAGGRASSPVEGPTSRFRVRIDDTSTSSIYEQIVSKIQEAVATGALQPEERLPSVRRLADELDIAPGTVARAYGELERIGVVVTEGARGTRVAEPQRATPSSSERRETLVGLLRPVAVAAFHLGATADELRGALDEATRGIMDGGGAAGA